MQLSRLLSPIAALILAVPALHASPITIDFGQSTQNLTQQGLGANAGGFGQWQITQGACSFGGVDTTCNLSGNYTGSTPGFTSGTYDLVTTYVGNGASPLIGTSTTPGGNFFYFSFIPATTTIDLLLSETAGPSYDIPIFASDTFINGYGLSYGPTTCSGVAVSPCSTGQVGLTPGAIIAGTITGSSTFNLPVAISPEPAWLWLAALLPIGFLAQKRLA